MSHISYAIKAVQNLWELMDLPDSLAPSCMKQLGWAAPCIERFHHVISSLKLYKHARRSLGIHGCFVHLNTLGQQNKNYSVVHGSTKMGPNICHVTSDVPLLGRGGDGRDGRSRGALRNFATTSYFTAHLELSGTPHQTFG